MNVIDSSAWLCWFAGDGNADAFVAAIKANDEGVTVNTPAGLCSACPIGPTSCGDANCILFMPIVSVLALLHTERDGT